MESLKAVKTNNKTHLFVLCRTIVAHRRSRTAIVVIACQISAAHILLIFHNIRRSPAIVIVLIGRTVTVLHFILIYLVYFIIVYRFAT